MAYCTITDIEKLLPGSQLVRLTDDEAAGAVDTDRVQEAIDSATEVIDSYIGARVKLPLSDSVPVLGKLCVDIAIFNLYSRVKENIPETREKRYNDAIRFLEKIAEGKISLGVQPPPDPPASGNYDQGSRVSVRDKIFDATTMDKF